jgi:ATP-binding cassette subfamily F protein uup
LARLFARPANVLVLDEPTNDLDIDTLELLEELIQDYDGTVFIVSHDRALIDQVVTSTLVYENSGRWREYEGGVQDWLIQAQRAKDFSAQLSTKAPVKASPKVQSQEKAKENSNANAPATPETIAPKDKRPGASAKLSFKEQKELDALPEQMAEKESRQQEINRLLSDPKIYQQEAQKASELTQELAAVDTLLTQMLERWEALTLKQEGLN